MKRKKYIVLYIFLSALLNVIFVTSNLICKKFIGIDFLGIYFEVSAGVLFFPLTFFISDILTEFYGKYYASLSVKICIINGGVIILLISLAGNLPAVPWSTVTDDNFNGVFSIYDISVAASCLSFYVCQLADINIFSAIKEKTSGKHLWLRNNGSSMLSQALDTVIIVTILCVFSIIPWNKLFIVVVSGYSFKFIMALLDTPFIYVAHYYIKKFLSINENKKRGFS